jgi:hypothetical protein
MGVGRLTDFYNVRHANDLQVESLDVVPVATRWPTDRFEAAAKAPPPRIRAGARVLELGRVTGDSPKVSGSAASTSSRTQSWSCLRSGSKDYVIILSTADTDFLTGMPRQFSIRHRVRTTW